MLMAVSRLSPVNIHILIPARLSFSIASATPSCNLSSIAVAPSKSNPLCSSFAPTDSTLAKRSFNAVRAIRYSASHSSYSCLSTHLNRYNNVLKPSSENSSMCSMVFSMMNSSLTRSLSGGTSDPDEISLGPS